MAFLLVIVYIAFISLGVPDSLIGSAWPCAFRLENLRWHKDMSFFDEGLTHIEGSLK